MGDEVREIPMQSAATAEGNGAAYVHKNGAVNDVVMQVTGIDGDTLTFEATIDGSNWVAVLATNQTSGTAATTATANGLYRVNMSGMALLRARISTYGSGTITVIGRGQA